jgi:putative ABC transport system ATP-binding protein
MISVDNLTKEFRLGSEIILALHDVTFQVARGEFVTVAGPSGCGKSTLLMSLGGLIHPSRGNIRIGGVDVYAQSPRELAEFRKKIVGFVFQQFHLVPYLRAWENVALALMLNGHDPQHHKMRALELLDRFELGSRANHRPPQLSVGQQQRVAMARTLANDPEIILADEPTASLDPTLSRNLMDTLKRLNESGKTIILVTHSNEVAAAGNRRLTLADGRLMEGQQEPATMSYQ